MLLGKTYLCSVFNSEPGEKSTILCHLGGIADDSVKKEEKTPQRRQCSKINKKEGKVERELDKRRNKEKRARGQMIGVGSTEPDKKEGERQ